MTARLGTSHNTVRAANLAELWQHDEWRALGACRHVDPDLFFPERGEDAREAKKVCASCPVIQPCREFGMREKHGIWGGLSERERRRLRQRRGMPEPADELDVRLTALRDQLERLRVTALAVEIVGTSSPGFPQMPHAKVGA